MTQTDASILAPRRDTRTVSVGGVVIGGGNPVRVQSMTNTDTRDVDATLSQIKGLAGAGCEIVRLAVLDLEAAMALKTICAATPVPLIADIHFEDGRRDVSLTQRRAILAPVGDGAVT